MEPSMNDAYRQLLPRYNAVVNENKALKAALGVAHAELEELQAALNPTARPKSTPKPTPSAIVEESDE